jgi:hypothetical protein
MQILRLRRFKLYFSPVGRVEGGGAAYQEGLPRLQG